MEKKAVKISGSMLDRAKKAEELLARAEAKGLGDFLPDDHPLKEEVDRQKSMLGGDLSGLPPGHPLLRALESAKRQYDEKKAMTDEVAAAKAESPDASAIKKAKKVDLDAMKREARRQEDEQTDLMRNAAADVNKGIEAVLKSTKDLFQLVAKREELLSSDPFCRVKAERLKRLLVATERGVSECRIARV